MSWTLDTSTTSSYSTANPCTANITCASNSRLLVVNVWIIGAQVNRTGTPTYNSINLTDSGAGLVSQAGAETTTETWYLLTPPTGSSYAVNVPNPTGASMMISVSSWIPSSGGCDVDKFNSGNGSSTDPSIVVNSVAANALMIGNVGSGYRNVPTAGTNYTILNSYDAGNTVWADEYDLDTGTAGNITVSFTQSTETWGLIGLSFKETLPTRQINKSEGLSVSDSGSILLPDALTANKTDTTALAEIIVRETLSYITKTDTVDASETTGLLKTSFVNKTDNTNVGESVGTLLAIPDVSILDTIALGESKTVEEEVSGDFEINVSPEDLIIQDFVEVAFEAPQLLEVNVSDNIFLYEPSFVDEFPAISKTDTIALADIISVKLPLDLEINKSDAIGVSDAANLKLSDLFIDKSDTIALAETENTVIPDSLLISVPDTIDAAEIRSASLPDSLLVGVSETIDVSEVTLVKLPDSLILSASDDIQVSETVSQELEDLIITTSDTIDASETNIAASVSSVEDLTANVSDSIVLAEELLIAEEDLEKSVQDNISVADVAQAAIPDDLLVPSILDTIALNESNLTVELTEVSDLYTNVSDNITSIDETLDVSIEDIEVLSQDTADVADIAQALLPNDLLLSVSDTIFAEDAAAILIPDDLLISVDDTIDISDAPQAVVPDDLSVSVSDSTNLDDFADIFIPEYSLEVVDTADVADTPELSLPEIGALVVSVEDTVDISDNIDAEIPDALILSGTDTLGVQEAANVDPLLIETGQSETVDVVDVVTNVTVSLPEDFVVARSDTVGIGEAVTISMADMLVDTAENISVDESILSEMQDMIVTVSDGSLVEEFYVTEMTRTLSVVDSTSLSDTTSLLMPDNLSITGLDNVVPGENVYVVREIEGEYNIVVSDYVLAGEIGGIEMGTLGVMIDPSILSLWTAGVVIE